jgi:hypothetical protein
MARGVKRASEREGFGMVLVFVLVIVLGLMGAMAVMCGLPASVPGPLALRTPWAVEWPGAASY